MIDYILMRRKELLNLVMSLAKNVKKKETQKIIIVYLVILI